jgi:acetyltransferase-like isoleucine patch superfamily enzyme
MELKILLKFARLTWKALTERTLSLPSMLRNFSTFLLGSIGVQLLARFQNRLHLGENVRIQKLRSLQLMGKESEIKIGDHSIVFEDSQLEAMGRGKIVVGRYSVLGECRISARNSVVIGDRVLTSWNVFIQDNDPHPLCPTLRAQQVRNICNQFFPRFTKGENETDVEEIDWTHITAPVEIGDDVWIGAGATVLKGARIGRGSIVGCGSVVTAGNYEDGSVLAGNPARVIRRLKILS